MLESFIYAPARSIFTFGFGGGLSTELAIEQERWEKECDQKRAKIAETFIEEKNERNTYRGLKPGKNSDDVAE